MREIGLVDLLHPRGRKRQLCLATENRITTTKSVPTGHVRRSDFPLLRTPRQPKTRRRTPMYRTSPTIFDPVPYDKGSALLQTPRHDRPGLDSDDERGIVPSLRTTS